jgi:hypothetical protein
MKKLLRFFLVLLSAGVVLSACQKELSAETGTAKGALVKDANGNCMPATPNGTFKKDTVLTNNNYVDIEINFTEIGNYFITTDTSNGYFFKASGVAALPGVTTVRLIGSGKPLVVGTDVFRVTFDGSICEFNINVLSATGGGGGGIPQANFTFGNTAGVCSATVNGIYAVGLPMTANNYVDLAVTVISAGTYNLSTALNGVGFSANATLAANATSIRLFANGSPTIAGPFSYLITSSGATATTCSFNVLFLPAITPGTFTYNCATGTTVQGIYQAGATMNPLTNTIKASVTVGTPGSYNINVVANNGVTFTAIGVLTATPAVQDITFVATGTAGATVGNVAYTLTGGTSNCTVSVPFIAGGGGGGATDSVSCKINGTFVDFDLLPSIQLDNTSFPLYTAVLITSDNSLNVFEAIQIGVGNLTTGDIPVGTYNVNQGPAILVGSQYTDGNLIDYTALTGTTNPTPAFSVTITSKSGPMGMAGTRVKGTFAGALKETAPGTGVTTITGGYFDLTFQ